jgi:type IV pilus assembly protein PilA
MKSSARHSPQGFTLIELLVVMAIVSILTAIAVPQYDAYKKRSFDLRAATDLHNIATAEEAYFMDNEEYLSCSQET